MKLEVHLQKHSLTQTIFAQRLSKRTGKSVAACAVLVSKIINHGHIPRIDYAEAIVDISGGDVTPNDFYGIEAEHSC